MKSLKTGLFLFVFINYSLNSAFADDHLFNSGIKQYMTFHASFDDNLNADSASGDKKAKLFQHVPTPKIFAPGVRNQALCIGNVSAPKERYTVRYSPDKNISSEKGTVTFWIKPEDWKPNGKQFNIFFSARTVESNMFIYKYPGENFCLLEEYKNKSYGNTMAGTNIGNWITGEWHFIACTWTANEFRLYVDGKQRSAVKRKYCPPTEFTVMQLGSCGWEVESGLSLIDEVKIYSIALDTDDINSEYLKYGIRSQSNLSVLTVGKKTPILDGKIDNEEYAFSGTGFFEPGGKYAHKQSHYHLSYDENNFYIAVTSDQKNPLKSDNKIHDTSIWQDDSVELWLFNVDTNTKYQIIVNSQNAVFDKKYTDTVEETGWNLPELRSFSRQENDRWIIEIAFPLKSINMNFNDDWRLNIARTFHADGSYSSCLSPVRKQLGYSDSSNFFKLVFKPDAPMIKISTIGDLNKQNVDFLFKSNSSSVICRLNYTTDDQCWFDETLKNEQNQSKKLEYKKNSLNPGGSLTVKISDQKDILYYSSFEVKLPSPIVVQYIYTEISKQLLRIVTKNESGIGQGKIHMSLTDKKTAKKIERNIDIPSEQLIFEIPWNISHLPDGDYDFEAAYIDPSGNSGEKFVQYYRKMPSPTPWDDTKIGCYKDVPCPWKPLNADLSKVEALKQVYYFDKKLLPAMIISNNKTITSRPITICINGTIESNSGSVELIKNTPREVVYKSHAKIANVNFNANVKIDYDGMLWVDLDISPINTNPIIIRQMYIDIPLKKEFAEQVHANDGDTYNLKDGFTGIVPEKGWHKNLFKKPAFWIGNEQAGLSWFAENLKGWHMQNHENSVEIIPGKSESIVRLNIVDTPLNLLGNRSLSFGFQGTPVKDPITSIRANRLGTEWGWANQNIYFNYYDPDPEFVDIDYLSHLRDYVYKGKKFFHYILSNGASPYAPDWGYWGKIWTCGELGNYRIETNVHTLKRRNKWVWTYTCLNSKSFRNHLLWSVARCIDDKFININNLYYDLVGPRMCSNEEHGCGWTDDWGNHYPTLNLLGTREFHMRMYELMKKKRPESMHIYHVTNAPAITAVTSFADALVDGETFFGNVLVEKESYFGIYTPELFRVSYYGQKWGTPTINYCQLRRCSVKRNPSRVSLWNKSNPPHEMKKAMRHYVGYVLVHDVQTWDAMENVHKYIDDSWKIFKDFLGEWDGKEEFIPYWDTASPVKVYSSSPDRIMASIYRRGDKAVIVIMNDTAVKQDIRILVDGKKLFNRSGQVAVETSEKSSLPFDHNVWNSQLEEQDFAIYLVTVD